MKKPALLLLLILFCHSLNAQTWSKKLEWVSGNYIYIHHDSAVGVKDVAVLTNGNICALAQVNQDELTRLFVIDPVSHHILWTKDFGQWGLLSSQFTRAITATSDTSVLVCANWYSQAADIHVHGFIYKYSSTGNVLWADTFLAVPSQMRTAADVIEANNGNYLALVGDTVYELNASTGIISQSIPALSNPNALLGNSMALHAVPGSTDFIVNGQFSAARIDTTGNIVWSVNHTQLQFTMHSAITSNAFYLLLNDTLNIINLATGAITNTVILPSSTYYSSLNASANGDLFASQGQSIHEFSTAVPDSGGIVKISSSGNILGVKSIPLPLCGVSWVSELPGGMLFCGGTYVSKNSDPVPNIIYTDYMPFCFTTDINGNGIMDSTTYLWPGDANHNHILQFSDDAIFIQQSFGSTGLSRDTIHYFTLFNGLDNSDFQQDWATVNTAGVDNKFCDVNGDGVVDATDLNAFNSVWYSFPVNVPYRTGLLPNVTFVPVTYVVSAGDTAKFYIIAGLTTPVDSVSGIAFSNMGSLNVGYQSVEFLPDNLGVPLIDTRTFCSPPSNVNFGNVVLSRIDRTNRRLSIDTIGIIKFIIPVTYSDTSFSTSITGIKAIKGNGTDVPVIAVNGTVTVSGTTFVPTIKDHEINLFPNPANDKIEISSNFPQQKAAIYNSIGKCVMNISSLANGPIDISSLSEGVYFIKYLPGYSYRAFVVCR